jgi:ribosomal protein L44E
MTLDSDRNRRLRTLRRCKAALEAAIHALEQYRRQQTAEMSRQKRRKNRTPEEGK